LINNSSAAMHCCTDQCSTSTKLQTSLYMMTVSMEAVLGWHAAFQIPKTVRCFDAPVLFGWSFDLISMRIRWAGCVASMFDKRDMYRVLLRKPEGVRRLGRPRRRWECNIKEDLD
jgi:hypothetical protein